MPIERKRAKEFLPIEVMMVVAVINIFAAIAIPTFEPGGQDPAAVGSSLKILASGYRPFF